MLGFSLQKILVLVAIVGAVWWGFKWFSRLDEVRQAKERLREKTGAKGERKRQGAERIEEMVECPHCKTYQLPTASGSCSNCGELV